jgi:hypothetical protein
MLSMVKNETVYICISMLFLAVDWCVNLEFPHVYDVEVLAAILPKTLFSAPSLKSTRTES